MKLLKLKQIINSWIRELQLERHYLLGQYSGIMQIKSDYRGDQHRIGAGPSVHVILIWQFFQKAILGAESFQGNSTFPLLNHRPGLQPLEQEHLRHCIYMHSDIHCTVHAYTMKTSTCSKIPDSEIHYTVDSYTLCSTEFGLQAKSENIYLKTRLDIYERNVSSEP